MAYLLVAPSIMRLIPLVLLMWSRLSSWPMFLCRGRVLSLFVTMLLGLLLAGVGLVQLLISVVMLAGIRFTSLVGFMDTSLTRCLLETKLLLMSIPRYMLHVYLSLTTLPGVLRKLSLPLVNARGVRLAVSRLVALLVTVVTAVPWLVLECSGGPTPVSALHPSSVLLSNVRQRGVAL